MPITRLVELQDIDSLQFLHGKFNHFFVSLFIGDIKQKAIHFIIVESGSTLLFYCNEIFLISTSNYNCTASLSVPEADLLSHARRTSCNENCRVWLVFHSAVFSEIWMLKHRKCSSHTLFVILIIKLINY